jgi:integrase
MCIYPRSIRENDMGRRSITGGVTAKGQGRIQFELWFEGVRYRPTLVRTPTEANLRRAREQLAGIKARITAGIFSFAEEFPEFRSLKDVPHQGAPRTCNQVFDAFIAHCESRVVKNDLATVTLACYRRILDAAWRPKLGAIRFLDVRYSSLVKIADEADWSKKSYNNVISVLRRAFKFGYRDYPEKHDPTSSLKSARLRKQDRPAVNPFRIGEAELLIGAIHRDWGEAQGNYDEFRFFTGLRPSEQIALLVTDFDPLKRRLTIDKARVAGIDKDSTKTGEARRVELCPRALSVLERQLALRARLQHEGRIHHDHLFFKDNGEPIRNLLYPYVRWRQTLQRLPSIRYRKPYCARHSSVSWNLMSGKNPLWVAKQHGHTITTMLKAYAAWAEGATRSDIQGIKRAMASEARRPERIDPSDWLRPKSSPTVAVSAARRAEARMEPGVIVAPPASFATGFATRHRQGRAKCSKTRGITGGERGIRTLEGLLTLTPLAGVRLRPLGHLSDLGL